MGSIALGVGSLVAVHSFRADVQRSLEGQARVLLGADVRVFESPRGSDVSDLLAAGGSLLDLVEIDLRERLGTLSPETARPCDSQEQAP